MQTPNSVTLCTECGVLLPWLSPLRGSVSSYHDGPRLLPLVQRDHRPPPGRDHLAPPPQMWLRSGQSHPKWDRFFQVLMLLQNPPAFVYSLGPPGCCFCYLVCSLQMLPAGGLICEEFTSPYREEYIHYTRIEYIYILFQKQIHIYWKQKVHE